MNHASASGPRNLPNKQNYLRFALFTIGLFWGVYVVELLTPIRVGDAQRDAMPWIVPVIATPITALCTWWRFCRAVTFAAGSAEVMATVARIGRGGVGVHTRVRLRYDFNDRSYERSVPLYDSVVAHLQVGSQIPILVSRNSPKRIQVPLNMEWMG
ncbi:hypothetical protein DES53_113104 [Roseimicrobium gellanilyticum]|uniref:Uncharacterized protein n=1 Tax=Roseimicrobium gellanilyticum TaxID=748857 RepID=A0A366H897_9BACT|nr:hypothetical protein [Roseimicrobium gellanilyticum]RBP37722.1 hypothetical protein DES53_113104 [Roseimicrobium gellanilyticum]